MKNLLKITFKCLVVIVFTVGSMACLSLMFRPTKYNQGNNFRGFDEDVFDVLVFGSSQAQYSFNPSVYFAKTGNYSYVLGSQCQAIPVSFEYLDEALKKQTPEVVLLDVFTMLPAAKACLCDGAIKVASDEMTGINQYRSLLYVEDKDILLDYWFGIRMYHGNWATLDLNNVSFPKDYIHDYNFGYVSERPKTYNYWDDFTFVKQTDYELKERDKEYLLKIQELCNEKGITLVLYKAPFSIDQESYDALQAVWKLAQENNIEFVDGFEAMEEMDFHLGMDGDAWHNDVWGARKMTEYLSDYLQEYHPIQSHVYNDIVEEGMKKLENESVFEFMNGMVDPYILLEIASNYDCKVALAYQGMNKTTISQSEVDLLRRVGFNDKDFLKDFKTDYFGITINHELFESSNENISYTYQGHTLIMNDEAIVFDGKTIDNSGEMTLIFFGNDLSWYEVVNIDYASKWFWRKGYEGWIKQE